jgi:hypothetical protein
MKASQQKVLDQFIQVLSFLDATQEVIPPAAVSTLQRQLSAAVGAINGYASTQARGGVRSDGGPGVHATRQALRDTFMRQVATMGISRLTGKHPGDPDVPNAAQIFRMPDTRTNSHTLISSAEAMVQAAMPYREAFAALGVDLSLTAAAAQSLASSLAARDTAKQTRVGATAGIGAAIRSGHEAVRLLDVVIRPFIAGNGRLVAQWKLARRTAGALNLGDPAPVPANLLAGVEAHPGALPAPATPTAALGSGQAALLTAGEPAAEPAAIVDQPATSDVSAAA